MRKAIKGALIALIATIALFVANTSAHASVTWWWYEPEMPKSLIKEA